VRPRAQEVGAAAFAVSRPIFLLAEPGDSMSQYSGLARGFIVYKSAGQMHITESGLRECEDRFRAGCSIAEVADFLCIKEATLAAMVAEGGQINELHRSATAEYRYLVRRAQITLAGENAQMARHLGQHALGQPKEPPAAEAPDAVKRVIGTMPDYKAEPADWLAAHRPKGPAAMPVTEQLRVLRDQNKAALASSDAADAASDEKNGAADGA